MVDINKACTSAFIIPVFNKDNADIDCQGPIYTTHNY